MGLRLSAPARREVIQRMAPRYQHVSASFKGVLLDEVVALTGYARRTALRLLNHPPQGPHPKKRHRHRRYGPEVQQVLFLLWHLANRICTKRLIPFLPTLIEALERHHHLHVSETCRHQLLTISAATADRLLRSQRVRGLGSPSTTRAGTWLKQHIPLRTFEQWNETCPGFLEVDLVAHCGREAQGRFLSTLTLTDIATGWTECLPLRSKNAQEVLSAFQTARALFPFPILGLDVDNGSEFLNEHLLTYCEQEGLTFTRGRPDLKNDQCFVEQKNGTVVRQVVGHERFEGAAVYQQLGEVYQALRLYVNCFQPSMKLQAKTSDGKRVRRIYDAAKTPLQRLLLSEVLSASQRRQVLGMAQMLDPLRLFEHLQDLQRALFVQIFAHAAGHVPRASRSFCLQQCLTDPQATRFQFMAHAGQQDIIQTGVPALISPCKPEWEVSMHASCSASITYASTETSLQHPSATGSLPVFPMTAGEAKLKRPPTKREVGGDRDTQPPMRSGRVSRKRSRHRPAARTMEQAVQDYLADLMRQHRRPKTLEWHEMALGSLQRYLLTEHHCVLVHHLTPAQMEGWLAFLQEHPTATGSRRTPSTVQSYARSARAFCQWLVQQKELPATPFAHLSLPQAANRVPRLLSPAAWERLLWACEHPKNAGKRAERARARNRALLWVLFDTGMRATEVCALRLCDVNREQGVLSVRGKGSQVRWLTLGQEGQHHLRIYLDDYRLAATSRELASASEQPLFLSEAGRPLTKSGVTRLFGRLRKRVGTTGEDVTASLLRQGFALRYLQTGGDPCTLPDLLGQQDCASLISLLNQNQEGCENDIQKPYPEAHRQRIS